MIKISRIKSSKHPQEIPVKRFYLENYEIGVTCPECGSEFKLLLYCNDCEHEWDEEINLDLVVTK